MLEGDTEYAVTTKKRFLINSTVGLGDLQDKAAEMGIEARKAEQAQDMAKPGGGAGIPIVSRMLGPSNLFDATGDITLSLANSLPLAADAGQGLVEYSDNQEKIKSIRKTRSMDMLLNERPIKVTKRQKSLMLPRFQSR